MRKYESVVIFNPELSEERVQENLQRIEGIAKNFEVSEWVIDRWGRKEMTYRVGKHLVGNYVILKFRAGKHDVVKELTSNYRIMDDVMKFQTHVVKERVRKFKGNLKARTPVEEDGDGAEFFA